MAVLDRSWYGRVLVERVEGFADDAAWRRAYEEIRDYEHMLAAEGMVLVKLWLHISEGEQLERFEKRAADPLKVVEADRARTGATARSAPSTSRRSRTWCSRRAPASAPWTLVEADSKRYARVKVIETVIAAAEDGMRRHGMKVP